LAKNNLVAPRAFAQLLAFTRRHRNGAGFLKGLPRSGQPGSLLNRFKGTPIEGHVVAKTGSVSRVNALSGYVEGTRAGTLVFSIIVNNHTAGSRAVLAQIDSLVVEMAR
jgi:D-alanyl-D-alanine carboxypeptidase/D-alanyl-D-alanine-endopeptidase (penicillin-binding protein 4)